MGALRGEVEKIREGEEKKAFRHLGSSFFLQSHYKCCAVCLLRTDTLPGSQVRMSVQALFYSPSLAAWPKGIFTGGMSLSHFPKASIWASRLPAPQICLEVFQSRRPFLTSLDTHCDDFKSLNGTPALTWHSASYFQVQLEIAEDRRPEKCPWGLPWLPCVLPT